MPTTPKKQHQSRKSKSGILLGVVFLLLAAMTTYFTLRNARKPTDEELAPRIASCKLTWQNYSEDIKTISSALAAQWQGAPIDVRRNGRRLQITFRMAGGWAQRGVAIPVLLREGRGGIYQSGAAECEAGLVHYTFELPEWADTGALPWIELKYPHGQRRIVLTQEGTWHSEDGS